jgi:hypothetical protein
MVHPRRWLLNIGDLHLSNTLCVPMKTRPAKIVSEVGYRMDKTKPSTDRARVLVDYIQ